jgi:prephenate dehydrogenase
MDILFTNREAVLAQVDRFACHLAEMRALLAAGEEAKLREKLAVAQGKRAVWKKR